MPLEIEPESYRCEAHDVDLTELVREALDESIPVAYGHRTRSFEVVISCPGGGSSHRVVAAGAAGGLRWPTAACET